MKQCVNTENSLNNDFDYKSSSITNEGSSNNYPIEFLSSEENKNPGNRDEYYSITNPEISESNSYSTFKSEFSEDESSSQKIRKRDDDEASADNEEESDLESDENGEELMPESDGNDELKTESSKNDELKTESSKNVELKPELGENRKFNPKSSENEEALNPESSENEEALAPESSDNEEALKSESDENEKESKPEPSKGGTFLGFGKPPISSPNDNEEVLPPPLSQNSSFPESDEEKNGKAEESVSISTSNLEESLILPTIGEGGIDYSDETYAFHSKPVPSDFSWQTGKSRTSGKRRGKGPAAAAARAKEFRPEDNWDEDSFYPRSFPRAWKLQKAKTVKPPQPMVSWNEFLVMQDKFQKNKLNPKLAPNNQLSLFHKSKDNLYNFVKDAIKRNKQIEKELMKLKKMLEK
ncbi:bromodomain-containing protein bet-1-like [Argiope bruennichi]|uniref:bromodomain-containing protein bet-1-like n=1 Tax=Argiope bruennichi TaxID=94029 RepID=UPI0024955DC2|nr:bromodomain-containing protein bet-1-like [Argiope bruennichi]